MQRKYEWIEGLARFTELDPYMLLEQVNSTRFKVAPIAEEGPDHTKACFLETNSLHKNNFMEGRIAFLQVNSRDESQLLIRGTVEILFLGTHGI